MPTGHQFNDNYTDRIPVKWGFQIETWDLMLWSGLVSATLFLRSGRARVIRSLSGEAGAHPWRYATSRSRHGDRRTSLCKVRFALLQRAPMLGLPTGTVTFLFTDIEGSMRCSRASAAGTRKSCRYISLVCGADTVGT